MYYEKSGGDFLNIALIAHDKKKELMAQFCIAYKGILSRHSLYATDTTGKVIIDNTGMSVYRFLPGPQGGDQQIGAKIVEGVINFVVFFSDPLTAQPHDPDVKALMRINLSAAMVEMNLLPFLKM